MVRKKEMEALPSLIAFCACPSNFSARYYGVITRRSVVVYYSRLLVQCMAHAVLSIEVGGGGGERVEGEVGDSVQEEKDFIVVAQIVKREKEKGS